MTAALSMLASTLPAPPSSPAPIAAAEQFASYASSLCAMQRRGVDIREEADWLLADLYRHCDALGCDDLDAAALVATAILGRAVEAPDFAS